MRYISVCVPVAVLLLSACATSEPARSSAAASPAPTLTDFWEGRADWELEIANTGLPPGESDTVVAPGGELWAYAHASTESAGVVDSCGEAVEFPGCVTRWVSLDGGRSFSLPDNTCLLACSACPCGFNDRTFQQQYPRVARARDGWWHMVFESHSAAYITRSLDGIHWSPFRVINGTGVWTTDLAPCPPSGEILPHPFADHDKDCMAGGPPGLFIDVQGRKYVFVGLGQNPGSMGCFWAWQESDRFRPCHANPLFAGAAEYGVEGVTGAAANPFFDFRYTTSAELVAQDGYYYMAYEGIRGPDSPAAAGDTQFALGLARSSAGLDAAWEKYPDNPVLGDVSFNWGVGHADLVVLDGVTYLYTASPELKRARYVLRFSR